MLAQVMRRSIKQALARTAVALAIGRHREAAGHTCIWIFVIGERYRFAHDLRPVGKDAYTAAHTQPEHRIAACGALPGCWGDTNKQG